MYVLHTSKQPISSLLLCHMFIICSVEVMSGYILFLLLHDVYVAGQLF